MSLSQMSSQLNPGSSVELKQKISFGMSILIKHDLVGCTFRTSAKDIKNNRPTGRGVSSTSNIQSDMIWTYIYGFKKD